MSQRNILPEVGNNNRQKSKKIILTSNFFIYICAVLTNQLSTMKSFNIISIIFWAIVACIAAACGGSVSGGKISEGVITYKLDYSESKSILVPLLPDYMTMTFKDNNTSMLIKGLGGCFMLNAIANKTQKQNYTAFSTVMGDKDVLISDFGDTPFGTEPMSDIAISQQPDTMTICGYLCHKAVGYSKQCDRNFTFWYTKDIDISSDCILSPIKSIDGVLMAFDIVMMGIYMKAKAVSVNHEKVPDETFEKPTGLNEVSRSELENKIHTFYDPTQN